MRRPRAVNRKLKYWGPDYAIDPHVTTYTPDNPNPPDPGDGDDEDFFTLDSTDHTADTTDFTADNSGA